MKNYFKTLNIKFWFRLFAVIDVVFAEKFEVTTWDKNGNQKSKTKFNKSEIEDKGYSGLL